MAAAYGSTFTDTNASLKVNSMNAYIYLELAKQK